MDLLIRAATISSTSTIASVLEGFNETPTTNACLQLSKPCGFTLIVHSIPNKFAGMTSRFMTEKETGRVWLTFRPGTCDHDALADDANTNDFELSPAAIKSIHDPLGMESSQCAFGIQSYTNFLEEGLRVFNAAASDSHPISRLIAKGAEPWFNGMLKEAKK